MTNKSLIFIIGCTFLQEPSLAGDDRILVEGQEIAFGEGGPYQGNVFSGIRRHAQFIATFETPSFPIKHNGPVSVRTGVLWVSNSLAPIIESTVAGLPLDAKTHDELMRELSHIIAQRKVPPTRDAMGRIRWVVVGVDEQMVRALCMNVIPVYAEEIRRERERRLALVEDYESGIQQRTEEIPPQEVLLESARAARDELGVPELSYESTTRANDQLAQELRMMEIALAGVRARIAAAERQKRSEEFAQSGLLVRMAELLLDLRIDLAGTLARREAIVHQADLLAKAQELSGTLQGLAGTLWNTKSQLQTDEAALVEHRAKLAEFEALGPFRVFGDKIVISPIAGSEMTTETDP